MWLCWTCDVVSAAEAVADVISKTLKQDYGVEVTGDVDQRYLTDFAVYQLSQRLAAALVAEFDIVPR